MRYAAGMSTGAYLLSTDGGEWQPSLWDGILFVILHYGLFYGLVFLVLPAVFILLLIRVFQWAEGHP